ncbi:GGDEF domain-containing protein [Cetobacterium sp. 2A]|uniref:GGDEF domain-containing protein n=1 Tax=Cetobacterium sp. 2A TaxID=2754723 RepID=UPI00163BFD01|nr:GGDEF domain-containing protein [Cetobacterium sp. 2A]MBC2856678.1 GGDEF domain-containing protein [Cetobacterium sp. 2A]
MNRMAEVFDNISTGIAIINDLAEVKFKNKYMDSLVKPEHLENKTLGDLFGNMFTCIYTEDRDKKCGETEFCASCPLRNSLKNVSEESQLIVFEKKFYVPKENCQRIFGINMKPLKENEILLELFQIKNEEVKERIIHYEILKKQAKKFKGQVFIDSLTGLYNRNFYEEKIEELYFTGENFKKSLSMILIDIDNFKGLNDNFGHRAGDETLRDISEIIKECMDKKGHSVRIGGDEFALFIDGNKDTAFKVAQNILNISKEASLSIGIAERKSHDEDLKSIYVRADEALYTVKKNGKGKVAINI